MTIKFPSKEEYQATRQTFKRTALAPTTYITRVIEIIPEKVVQTYKSKHSPRGYVKNNEIANLPEDEKETAIGMRLQVIATLSGDTMTSTEGEVVNVGAHFVREDFRPFYGFDKSNKPSLIRQFVATMTGKNAMEPFEFDGNYDVLVGELISVRIDASNGKNGAYNKITGFEKVPSNFAPSDAMRDAVESELQRYLENIAKYQEKQLNGMSDSGFSNAEVSNEPLETNEVGTPPHGFQRPTF